MLDKLINEGIELKNIQLLKEIDYNLDKNKDLLKQAN